MQVTDKNTLQTEQSDAAPALASDETGISPITSSEGTSHGDSTQSELHQLAPQTQTHTPETSGVKISIARTDSEQNRRAFRKQHRHTNTSTVAQDRIHTTPLDSIRRHYKHVIGISSIPTVGYKRQYRGYDTTHTLCELLEYNSAQHTSVSTPSPKYTSARRHPHFNLSKASSSESSDENKQTNQQLQINSNIATVGSVLISSPRNSREHTPKVKQRRSEVTITTPEAAERFDFFIKENLPLHMHNIPLPTKPLFAHEGAGEVCDYRKNSR